MSSKAIQLDNEIQRLLDSKGFPYVVDQLSKWVRNKYEHVRAYSPEDTEDLRMYCQITKQLEDLLNNYK